MCSGARSWSHIFPCISRDLGSPPLLRPKTPRTPMSWDPKDDVLLKQLKEEQRLGWKEIANHCKNTTLAPSLQPDSPAQQHANELALHNRSPGQDFPCLSIPVATPCIGPAEILPRASPAASSHHHVRIVRQ